MTAHCGRCYRGDIPTTAHGHLHQHMTGCRRGVCTNHPKCPHKTPCQGAGHTPQETYR